MALLVQKKSSHSYAHYVALIRMSPKAIGLFLWWDWGWMVGGALGAGGVP